MKDKIVGTMWLIVFALNAMQVVFFDKWYFVFAAIINLALVEFHLQPVYKVLDYIHTEVYFFQAAKRRRQQYANFKSLAKGLSDDDFEAGARLVIK